MKNIKDKIKYYNNKADGDRGMLLVSDDGFQAVVHTNNYNDGNGNKINAILIYNNDNGDGLYGKPTSVISVIAYDIITVLNK